MFFKQFYQLWLKGKETVRNKNKRLDYYKLLIQMMPQVRIYTCESPPIPELHASKNPT